MTDRSPAVDPRAATNQAPALVGHNVVTTDVALTEAITRHGSTDLVDDLAPLGAEAGSAEAREHGMLANRHHPELTTYDRFGNRIDEVEFHPSWHWLIERAVGHGLQAAPWEQQAGGDPHAHLRRAAGFFAWSQTEPGHGCPISMTYAAVPALRADDAIAKVWTPLLAARSYVVSSGWWRLASMPCSRASSVPASAPSGASSSTRSAEPWRVTASVSATSDVTTLWPTSAGAWLVAVRASAGRSVMDPT